MDEKEKQETKAEMKERLREEIMAELLAELKEEKKALREKETVKVAEEEVGLEENGEVEIAKREVEEKRERELDRLPVKKTEPKEIIENRPAKKERAKSQEEEVASNTTKIVAFVSLLIIGIGVFFFPQIDEAIRDIRNKLTPREKVEEPKPDPGPELETMTWTSEAVKNLKYPIMRNNRFSSDSQFRKDSITMTDFTNNDILYNAFVDIHFGNLATYTEGYSGTYCGTNETKKTFNARYIETRIDNIFSKDTKFEHGDFKVPSTYVDVNKPDRTTYLGTWKYDAANKRYIYYGNCDGTNTGANEYYDVVVQDTVKGLNSNINLEVTFYQAVARVEVATRNYILFKDANMTEVLVSGTLTTNNAQNELNTMLKNLTDQNTAVDKYKYTFSNADCSYRDYCFEKGEWVK